MASAPSWPTAGLRTEACPFGGPSSRPSTDDPAGGSERGRETPAFTERKPLARKWPYETLTKGFMLPLKDDPHPFSEIPNKNLKGSVLAACRGPGPPQSAVSGVLSPRPLGSGPVPGDALRSPASHAGTCADGHPAPAAKLPGWVRPWWGWGRGGRREECVHTCAAILSPRGPGGLRKPRAERKGRSWRRSCQAVPIDALPPSLGERR